MEEQVLKENLDITNINNNKHLNIDYLNNYNYYLSRYKLVEYNIDSCENFTQLELGKFYRIVGRIMFYRRMGKLKFIELHNYHQKLQIMCKKDVTFEYSLLDKLARGDIIFVEGVTTLSNTGVLSLVASKWGLVSKTIMEHPDKVSGIKEGATYKSKRYLQYIYDEKLVYNLLLRSKLISQLRKELEKRGYLEIDTPVLSRSYGGANAKPFKTKFNATNEELYLSISCEFNLKNLIFGGWKQVYSLARNFRNEGIDSTHHCEFSMVEFYIQNKDCVYMYKQTMDIIIALAKTIKNTTDILYQGHTIKLENYSVISYEKILDLHYPYRTEESIRELLHIDPENTHSKEELDYMLFDDVIVPKLIQPTCVTELPLLSTPLAKYGRNNNRYVEQCEIYVAGYELANICSEENLVHDMYLKKVEHSLNKEYMDMLSYGQYIHGGSGIGIDRLVMLFANESSILKVLFETL